MSQPLTVQLFAKAPVALEVKTRLAARLGAGDAARLYDRVLHGVLANACRLTDARTELWVSGDPDHRAFANAKALYGVTIKQQAVGDLGLRMQTAAAEGLTRAAGVILVGGDCASVDASVLATASRYLRAPGHDAVLGPADDGGYVLLGLRRVHAHLFEDVDWGGDRVLGQTRQRLQALGWRWRELATGWDLDRPEDLARLDRVRLPAPLSEARTPLPGAGGSIDERSEGLG